MVIPFRECVARPKSGDGNPNLLTDHLLAVAKFIGDPKGDDESRMRFLAGLCHDAGKAARRWQMYILSKEEGRVAVSGGSHSPLGSLIFFVCSEQLVTKDLPRRFREYLITQLTLDIAGHHGSIKNIDPAWPPWEEALLSVEGVHSYETVDLDGFFDFVRGFFPEITLTSRSFVDRLQGIDRRWAVVADKALGYAQRYIDNSADRDSAAAGLIIRDRTSAMISADRFHAAGLDFAFFHPEEARVAINNLAEECSRLQKNAAPETLRIVKLRNDHQKKAMETYRTFHDRLIYSLELATGLGKTLTALRIALEAVASGRCSRVIYVAPYISILSQATNAIREATGIPDIIEHHHLSFLEMDYEHLRSEEDGAFLIDSWQSKIVTTTFNQFFLALFPIRAQHTVRIQALENAFVIIDEPQIIEPKAWAAFLKTLEAAAKRLHFQSILCTATLPYASDYLSEEYICLSRGDSLTSRYIVKTLEDKWDVQTLAELAVKKLMEKGSVAVILNTVADAARVYMAVKDLILRGNFENITGIDIFNLTGCMTPLHKSAWISRIKDSLRRGKKCIVVCTQILEAGVDLSFRCVIRARPVIPSVIQAAGRGNRHGEGDPAEVLVVDFVRDDGEDPRKYVYRNPIFREVTDEQLRSCGEFSEKDSREIIENFYREAFKRNPPTGKMRLIYEAAMGQWSKLEEIEPFEGDYPKVMVFVPRVFKGSGGPDIPEIIQRAMKYFGISGVSDIYQRYLEKGFWKSLSFRDKKLFMALIEQFCVCVSVKKADSIVTIPEGAFIGSLVDDRIYSEDTGMALSEDSTEFRMY
ncbi:CRISPR-associated helicase Cas3' [Thermosediminibacter litoriperuensis]|uniref:CRISPR-associated helicase Cas3 n=1 Tax=Thermosediminibacter litoriperuensis TaxID=291989 RepID=A0A5S5ANL2_9FIRM|nr:CRISPR-associated helicase Cas3' [Thermosediminibacter litoriperuensis]TYP51686.1 CRISPR-associated helicase Cas3 [Thermosediminibacter litoriperuensis]